MSRSIALFFLVSLIAGPAIALADVAPSPPELPVVGIEANPLHVIIAGVVLSAAVCLCGLAFTRWLPVKVVAPMVVFAVVGCVTVTALCAGWAISHTRSGGNRRVSPPPAAARH